MRYFARISANFFRGHASLHWGLMPLVRPIILALLTLALVLPVAGAPGKPGMVICVDASHVAVELDHDHCGDEEHGSPSDAGLHAPDETCTDLTLGSVLNTARVASSLAAHHALIAVAIDLVHAQPAGAPAPLISREASPPLPDLVSLSTIVLIV